MKQKPKQKRKRSARKLTRRESALLDRIRAGMTITKGEGDPAIHRNCSTRRPFRCECLRSQARGSGFCTSAIAPASAAIPEPLLSLGPKTLCTVGPQLIDSMASFFVGFRAQNHMFMGNYYRKSGKFART
jgi:hypothetical protein